MAVFATQTTKKYCTVMCYSSSAYNLDLRLFEACLTISSCPEEMADPFEGPANVLFEVVDDEEEVINKVMSG